MTVYKFASSFWYTQGGKRRRNIKYIVEVHLRPKGTNESSSNKGLPHIRHSVYIRGAGISTIDSSSLGSSPATNTAPGTDPMQYPEAVVVDEVACNPTAVYDQVVLVAKYHPHRLREFIFTAANLVGAKFCQHSEEPRPLSDELTLQEKQVGARAHPGLCGYFHAGAIAGVETEDVEMRGETTGNRFRNQACFDAARQLHATGPGVQVERKECFTQACRAVFPGNSALDAAVVTALRNG